ncbi:MAG: hypothetical protein QOF65_2989 [Thermoleophilaceae bacterium]|nr:hypothetical protein [Thermoleophilaceae bacterium]
MSFFDEGDEPTRVTRPARPRRPATGSRAASGGGGGRGGSGRGVDPQTLRVRQAVAAGVGILVIFLLFFGLKGCLDSRKERKLKDYNRDVTAVISDSNDQVSKPFFDLLSGGGKAGDLQVQVNQLRLVADEDARRARGFSVPGEMKRAQSALTLVLNFRAEGLEQIAKELPAAQSKGNGSAASSERAVRRIAGEMQKFLASDVVYSQRVIPYIKQALDDATIGGQTIPPSRFLRSLTWLAPATVANAVGATGVAGSSTTARGPGPHGHGLTSVTAGGVALQPSPATNRVPAGAGLAFDVKFQNQGASDETNVKVNVKVTGGTKPITATRTIDQTKAGSPAEVSIPLATTPPVGTPVRVVVTVGKVPGEQKTDNNTQTYTVIFTR